MRHALWVSALFVVVVSAACTQQRSGGGVPESSVTAMAAYRCTPAHLADMSNDIDTCAAKTMAGQRVRR